MSPSDIDTLCMAQEGNDICAVSGGARYRLRRRLGYRGLGWRRLVVGGVRPGMRLGNSVEDRMPPKIFVT
jgi:hypothetical protein